MASIHRDLCGSGALLLLDWERKKAPLVPPNGMVRALGRYLTFAEASIGGGSHLRAVHRVAARDCDGGSARFLDGVFYRLATSQHKSRRWPHKIAKDLNAEATPDSVVVLLELGDVGTRRPGPKPVSLKVLSRTSSLGS